MAEFSKIVGQHELLTYPDGSVVPLLKPAPYQSIILSLTRSQGTAHAVGSGTPYQQGVFKISSQGEPVAYHGYQNQYIPMGRTGALNGNLSIVEFGSRSYISAIENMLSGRSYEAEEPILQRSAIFKDFDATYLFGKGVPTYNEVLGQPRTDNSLYNVATKGQPATVSGLMNAVNNVKARGYSPVILTSSIGFLQGVNFVQAMNGGTPIPGVFDWIEQNARIVEFPTLGLAQEVSDGTNQLPYFVFARELLHAIYINGFEVRSDFTPAGYDPYEQFQGSTETPMPDESALQGTSTGVSYWTNAKDAVRTITGLDAGFFGTNALAYTSLNSNDLIDPNAPLSASPSKASSK